MKERGYLLIELMIASVLLSFAGALLYMNLSQDFKAEKIIRETSQVYDPLRTFWKQVEKDLRNSVYTNAQNFNGGEQEMTLPILEQASDQSLEFEKIHYAVRGKDLIREETEISNHFKKRSTERTVFRNFEKLQFEYAYLDGDEKLAFKSYWIEEPYYGIPKAVRINLKFHGSQFSKLISIPQGKWGRVMSDSL